MPPVLAGGFFTIESPREAQYPLFKMKNFITVLVPVEYFRLCVGSDCVTFWLVQVSFSSEGQGCVSVCLGCSVGTCLLMIGFVLLSCLLSG